MATIKEVAKLAGVSISTVSRTLSKKVFVEEETRDRVMKAVEQLAYKPNLMAKGLKEGHSKTLALVLPDIQNPFFPTLIKFLERHAASRGYSIILYDTGGDLRQEKRSIEELKYHYIDGVVYVSATDDLSLAKGLLDRNIPVVALNRESDSGVPCLVSDSTEGARRTINYLIANGHRKIACMAAPLDKLRYKRRLQGCRQAFEENGIDDYKRYLIRNVNDIETAYNRTKKMLARADRPTAFYVFFDMMALGVYSGVHDSGLSVPDDISVAGYDNIYLSQHLIPPLTTYEQPVDKLAKLAIATLVRLIEEPGNPPAEPITEVKGSLIIRKSVKPI